MNKDYQQLRKVFGGQDSFVAFGHQIVNLRKRKRSVPEWTRNNKEIRKVLLKSFPKLMVNQKQRDRASRWARVIHLYFRLQWTSSQTAEEIGINVNAVRMIISRINRVANGRRSDNSGKLGARPKGRPKGSKKS